MKAKLKILENYLSKLPAVEVLEVSINPVFILFKCVSDITMNDINLTLAKMKSIDHWSIIDHDLPFQYKICILSEIDTTLGEICQLFKESQKNKMLGIPDLAWVTIPQMINEFKRRNIIFSLIWSEEKKRM